MSKKNSERNEFGKLLADLDFLEIDQRLKATNVFSVFQMEYVAAKHSSFLAWLLDPNEDHGLEDMFLKRFLSAALMSPPPDFGKPAEGISPIPYEAVHKKLLKWDRMDVLSADLRETNVRTNLCRRADGGRVDICIWNEPYSFAVYVENVVQPKHSWQIRKGPIPKEKEHQGERSLLDLYASWASEEGGAYDILPVFLSLGDVEPSDTRCFHRMDYIWMPTFLERLMKGTSVSPAAKQIIEDFCEWLRFEMPEVLDSKLFEKVARLTQAYGYIICRMLSHVSRCNGCDENDVVTAYHDVYRRHRITVDYLADFAQSLPTGKVSEIKSKVDSVLDDSTAVFSEGATSLSVRSEKWRLKGVEPGLYTMEVSVSFCSRSVGVNIYVETLNGNVNKLLELAADVAEEMDLKWDPPGRLSRIVSMEFFQYDEMKALDAAGHVVKLFNYVDEIFKRMK